MIFTSGQNGGQFNFHSKNQFAMPPYHILIVIISSVILENLALLTKSEQSGPKPAHIRPTTLAIIISYPTSASGNVVLYKTSTKYRKFFPTLFIKATDFQLVFNFEQARTVPIFGEHGIMAHIS